MLAVLLILLVIFLSSLIFLVILCRYKNVRKRTAVYVKRLAKSDNSETDFELTKKQRRFRPVIQSNGDALTSSPTHRFSNLFTSIKNVAGPQELNLRCSRLLDMCNSLDLSNSDELTGSDLEKLRDIVQMARNITDESNAQLDHKENSGLLECKTTDLLTQVARALSKMDHQLFVLKETSLQDLELFYQNTVII